MPEEIEKTTPETKEIKLIYFHLRGGSRILLAFREIEFTMNKNGATRLEGEPVAFETFLKLIEYYPNLEWGNVNNFVLADVLAITIRDFLNERKQKKLGVKELC